MELNEAMVLAIRQAYFNNETIRGLANLYGCSEREIGRIVHGKSWQWVGGPIHGSYVGVKRYHRTRIKRPPIARAARMGLSWEEAKQLEAAS